MQVSSSRPRFVYLLCVLLLIGKTEARRVEYVDCTIVGGGPAGLTTAIFLSKASPSSSVAVFEKDAFERKGASVGISKAGWKALRGLDKATSSKNTNLISSLKKMSSPIKSVDIKPWFRVNNESSSIKQNAIKKRLSKIFQGVISFILQKVLDHSYLWHDVRMILADHAMKLCHQESQDKSTNAQFLNLNCSLVGIVECKGEKQRFELTFANKKTGERRTIRTNFIFACDGSNSAVRSILPKDPDVLLSERRSVWRGIAPDVDSHGRATILKGAANSNTMGRSAIILPAGKEGGSSWTVISDIQDGKSKSIDEAKVRVLSVMKTMGETDKDLQENLDYQLFKHVIEESTTVVENKLYVRDFEDSPWNTAYDGLVYIGDAAHPVRPTGEGLALAFEDANVLQQIVSRKGLSIESLRDFEEARYLPVKETSEKVRAQANNFYQEHPDR